MVLSFSLLIAPAFAHVPVVYVTTPDEDWCGVIAAALGGDIIQLAPGTYTGPCAIDGMVSEPIGESTIVQSLDPNNRAVLVAGSSDHVLAVSGVHVTLLSLDFPELAPGTDAVRIGYADDITIGHCTFSGAQGVAIRQTGYLGDLTIEHNEMASVAAAALLGCDDGGCGTGGVLVEDNLVTASGEGFTLRGPASGTVRDNMLFGMSGIGITASGGGVVLEGNLVESSSTAIDVRSGPALLRSQILLAPVGVFARGDTGAVRIVGNTVLSWGGEPLRLDGWGPGRGLRVSDNAIDAALPDVGGAEASGNVACLDLDACFTDAAAWDFFPLPGGLLREGSGLTDPELFSDWCGLPRQSPPTPGALEAFGDESYGSLPTAAKEDVACETTSWAPPTTDVPPPIGPGGIEYPTYGPCACGAGSFGAAAPWWIVALLATIRSRGRTSARRTAPRVPAVRGLPVRRG